MDRGGQSGLSDQLLGQISAFGSRLRIQATKPASWCIQFVPHVGLLALGEGSLLCVATSVPAVIRIGDTLRPPRARQTLFIHAPGPIHAQFLPISPVGSACICGTGRFRWSIVGIAWMRCRRSMEAARMVRHTIHEGAGADSDCCPFIDGNHRHCRSRFTLGQLGRAMQTCVGNFRSCSVHWQLQADQQLRPAETMPVIITLKRHVLDESLRPTGS